MLFDITMPEVAWKQRSTVRMNNLPDNLNLLQQLMDNMTDNIFFKNRDHQFIMINRANAEWFGFASPAEAVGKTDFDLFADEFARKAQEDENLIMASEQPMLGDEEQTLHNGEQVWGHVTKVPLRDINGNVIGIIGIGRDITALKRKELELAEANLKLNETARQIEADLQMAARLQQTFLPQTYPQFVTDDGQPLLDFYHYYKADIALGGDFCAVDRLSDTRAGLLICDVMGHGVRAALVTGIIRSFADEIARNAESPGDYLTKMNEKLYPILRTENEYIFATACYLVIDVSTGVLTGAIAGHTPPFLIRSAAIQSAPLSIDPGIPGPALAVMASYPYRNFSLSLEPGDKVLLYTDGVCEAENGDGVEYAEHRLQQTIQANCTLSIRDLVHRILDDVEQFAYQQELGDDVCLIGFTFNGREQAPSPSPGS